MPSGMPMTSPTTATVAAWARIVAAVWRGVKPMARSTASSPRRRRTAVTSAWPSAATPSSTRKIDSARGSGRTFRRFSTSWGMVTPSTSAPVRRCRSLIDAAGWPR